MLRRDSLRMLALLALFALLLAACGDDAPDDAAEPDDPIDEVGEEPDEPDDDPNDDPEPDEPEEATEDDDPVPLRFAYIPGASQSYVPRVIVDEGIDQAHGIELELVEYAEAGGQYPALRADEIDVAGGNFLSVLIQRDADLDIQGFRGMLGFGAPIIAQPDGPQSVADLEGASFGAPNAGLLDFHLFRTAIQEIHGFDLQHDTDLVEAAPPLLNEMLLGGDLDAAWQFSNLAYGPVARGELDELTTVDALMNEAGLDTDALYLVWIIQESWIEEHGDALDDVVAMMAEGEQTLREREDLWPELAASSGIDDPDMVDGYMQTVLAQMDVDYSPDVLEPTGDLVDALVEVVGEAPLGGVTEVDPDAFIFPGQG